MWCVIALAVILILNASLGLLNEKNDMAALAGFGLLVLLVSGLFGLLKWRGKLFWTKHKDKIKNVGLCVAGCAFVVSMSGCYKVVEPGRVGIKVKQTGGDRGVQDIPIETGRVFYNPVNEYVLEYPTSVQRAIWTKSPKEGNEANEEIAFQSMDGLHFTGDVAVAYHLPGDKVPHFYVRFRSDNLDNFTHGFFRDAVRKCIGASAKMMTAEEVNGGKQSQLEQESGKCLTEVMDKNGVVIDQLAFTSPPRPPDIVRQSIEGKIAAIQKAEQIENEKRQSTAEAQKFIALANGTAEANRLVNASLTPQLVEWRKLDVMQSKWNGQGPLVVGAGQGMMIDVRSLVK